MVLRKKAQCNLLLSKPSIIFQCVQSDEERMKLQSYCQYHKRFLEKKKITNMRSAISLFVATSLSLSLIVASNKSIKFCTFLIWLEKIFPYLKFSITAKQNYCSNLPRTIFVPRWCRCVRVRFIKFCVMWLFIVSWFSLGPLVHWAIVIFAVLFVLWWWRCWCWLAGYLFAFTCRYFDSPWHVLHTYKFHLFVINYFYCCGCCCCCCCVYLFSLAGPTRFDSYALTIRLRRIYTCYFSFSLCISNK